MEPSDPRSDEDLVLAIAAGDATAVERFKTRQATTLDRICASVTPDGRSRAEAYRDLMTSADFAALFAGVDGRSKWTTFVIVAVVNRFLFPRLLRRLDRDPVGYAGEFEAFFRRDVTRAVRLTIPRRDLDQDASQWIWERLLDKNAEHLRRFVDQARTPGFVFVKLRRLAQDFLNSREAPAEGRKRVLPECLNDMPSFEQDVYRQFYWRRASSARIAVLALRQRHPEATEATVMDARTTIERVLQAHGGLLVVEREPKSLDDETVKTVASDDQPILEEVERAAFRKALLRAARDLNDREKLCLLKRLQGKSAGEIAGDLNMSNPEAYDLMRKVLDKLRRALSSHPAARARIATITGDDSYVAIDPKPGAGAGLRPETQ